MERGQRLQMASMRAGSFLVEARSPRASTQSLSGDRGLALDLAKFRGIAGTGPTGFPPSGVEYGSCVCCLRSLAEDLDSAYAPSVCRPQLPAVLPRQELDTECTSLQWISERLRALGLRSR